MTTPGFKYQMANSTQMTASLTQNRHDFIRRVMSGLSAQWPMSLGVEFDHQSDGTGHHLQMRYYRNACSMLQIREILVHRFEHADTFHNCRVAMDNQNNLVIHAPTTGKPMTAEAIEAFLTQSLALCRL